MRRKPLTEICHQAINAILKKGDYAVDATIGNGHDTLLLAKLVGEKGLVYGFDIQPNAIVSTSNRLKENSVRDRVHLVEASHALMHDYIPMQHHGKIKTVMFNLGYLPGTDKRIITKTDSTLTALKQAIKLVHEEGVISIMIYPGHPGGDSESQAVLNWCRKLDNAIFSTSITESGSASGPSLVLIYRQHQNSQ